MLSRLHRRLYLFPALLLSLEWACSLLFVLTLSADIEGMRQLLLLAGTASGIPAGATGIGAFFSLPRTGPARGFAAIHGFLQLLVLSVYGVFSISVWHNRPLPVEAWPLLGIKTLLLLMLFSANRVARYIRRGTNPASVPHKKTDGTPI